MLAATLAAADVGQSVVAALLGLGATGVAGGVVAMAWSAHVNQIRLAGQLARHEAAAPADNAAPARAATDPGAAAQTGNGSGVPRPPGYTGEHVPRPGPAPSAAIEGPDSVIAGEQARYRVHRSGAQHVVAWAAGGGPVSQAADPAHPDDLLLVADRPGNLIVSVRLRDGLTEHRETKAVTAVAAPAAVPPVTLRLFLQDWPLAVVSVLTVGFAGALVALGSLAAASFIALSAPVAALLGVVATARRSGGSAEGTPCRRSSRP